MSGALRDEPLAVIIAVGGAGLLFLAGLLLGVWKHQAIVASPARRAPVYVDIAHRAALLYSFAALVLARFAAYCPFPAAVTSAAVAVPLICFASAVGTYVMLGRANQTDNQFERRTFVTTYGIWMLTVGEIGGFAVLLAGFVVALAG